MHTLDTRAAPAPVVEGDHRPVVVFKDVSIGFDSNEVLKDISFQVAPGETRVLLGPAGVGKSVLLKLANGLMCPDSGTITVFGEEVSSMPEESLFQLRQRIGMVFQEGALFDSLTVRDNVAYRLIEEHVEAAEIDKRVIEALRFVELEAAIDKLPSQISGGMRRRVAIARAIVSRPDLLLYDSPTGGLDPITSTTIIELIVKQRDVYRTSSLLVTHRLQDAFTMAMHRFNRETNKMELLPEGEVDPLTSFLMLHEGKLIFDGSTHDLMHSDDPYIKNYLT
jgi:phospholipid/cholesterol/gamma-HCH transport system ATP-binding protein